MELDGTSAAFGFVPCQVVKDLQDIGNWKVRADAIERLQTLVGNLATDDLPLVLPSLLDFVKFLNKLLADPNFKISLTTLQIFTALVSKVGSEIRPYVKVVMPSLVEKLGDNKIVVRQANIKVLVKLLAVVKPRPVLEAVMCGLNHTNWRVREETLNIAIFALMTYNKSEFDFQSLSKYLSKATKDDNPRIRAVSIEAFNVMHTHVGSRITSYLEEVTTEMRAQLNERFTNRSLPTITGDNLVEHVAKLRINGTSPEQQENALPSSVATRRNIQKDAFNLSNPSTKNGVADDQNLLMKRRQNISPPRIDITHSMSDPGSLSSKIEAANEYPNSPVINGQADIGEVYSARNSTTRERAASGQTDDWLSSRSGSATDRGGRREESSDPSGAITPTMGRRGAPFCTTARTRTPSYGSLNSLQTDTAPIDVKDNGLKSRSVTGTVTGVTERGSESTGSDYGSSAGDTASDKLALWLPASNQRLNSPSANASGQQTPTSSCSTPKATPYGENGYANGYGNGYGNGNLETSSGLRRSNSRRNRREVNGEANGAEGMNVANNSLGTAAGSTGWLEPASPDPRHGPNGSRLKDVTSIGSKLNLLKKRQQENRRAHSANAVIQRNHIENQKKEAEEKAGLRSLALTVGGRGINGYADLHGNTLEGREGRMGGIARTVSTSAVPSATKLESPTKMERSSLLSEGGIRGLGNGNHRVDEEIADRREGTPPTPAIAAAPTNRKQHKLGMNGTASTLSRQHPPPATTHSPHTGVTPINISDSPTEEDWEWVGHFAPGGVSTPASFQTRSAHPAAGPPTGNGKGSPPSNGVLPSRGGTGSGLPSSASNGSSTTPGATPGGTARKTPGGTADVSGADIHPVSCPETVLRSAVATLLQNNQVNPKEVDWEAQFEALLAIKGITVYHQDVVTQTQLHQTFLAMIPCCDALRSTLSKSALQVCADMVATFETTCDFSLDSLVPALLKKSGEGSFLGAEADRVLYNIVEHCTDGQVAASLMKCAGHKSAPARAKCGFHLEASLCAGSPKMFSGSAGRDLMERVLSTAVGFLDEGLGETRGMAKRILWQLNEMTSAQSNDFEKALRRTSEQKQKQVKAILQGPRPDMPKAFLDRKSALSRTGTAATPTGSGRPSGTASLSSTLRSNDSEGRSKLPERSAVTQGGVGIGNGTLKRGQLGTGGSNGGTDEGDLEELDRNFLKLQSKDWRERSEAVAALQDMVLNCPCIPEAHLHQLLDVLIQRLTDGNSKVNVQALTTLKCIFPALGDTTAGVVPMLLPALAANCGSSNDKIRISASEAVDSLIRSLDSSLLLQHLTHAVAHSSLRSKGPMLDKLTKVLPDGYTSRPQHVVKYVLPAAFKLLDEAKGEIRSANSRLIQVLCEVMGPQQIRSHANSYPATTQCKLEEIIRTAGVC